MVPGNNVSIARQFIRCCLHQLAPNGIFPMLFQSGFEGKGTFVSVTSHINCIVACCLINVVHLTACAFIRSIHDGVVIFE